MSTNDLSPVTKISLSMSPTDPSLHQVVIERGIGSKDGAKSNAVPVFSEERVVEISRMRRG